MQHKQYPGSTDHGVTQREERNRRLARKAAAEGMVLLQNDGTLPLQTGARVVLFGAGSLHAVKGGTGSGDVNERTVVSVYDGMKDAGLVIANENWLSDYANRYDTAWEAWRQGILQHYSPDAPRALLSAYLNTPFVPPKGRAVSADERKTYGTQTAVYVLSRQAGEGKDRTLTPGDYYLSDDEKADLEWINSSFANLVLVLNSGGPVDLGFLDTISVSSLIYMCQAGMEGGNALADVLSGKTIPCGKLTDTWAKQYTDYPSAATYNNDADGLELYTDGIFVGYRYFDTFAVQPRFPFGYGLSYTDFSIQTEGVAVETAQNAFPVVNISAQVTNTGNTFRGREVVQVYVSCPQGTLQKEYQRLCAFAKTPELSPGESTTVTLSFSLEQLLSFSQEQSAYILEKGDYCIAIGNSSRSTCAVHIVRLSGSVRVRTIEEICPLAQPLKEISAPVPQVMQYTDLPISVVNPDDIPTCKIAYDTPAMPAPEGELVDSLSTDQLLQLVNGDISKRNFGASNTIGSSGISVPGAAGETSACASQEPWNIQNIVLADGPAGLRLAKSYQVLPNGEILRLGFAEILERGIFAPPHTPDPAETTYYQYCTAFPVGTLLAQTWDVDLLKAIGVAVADEMQEFGVTLWLAPGMNIHRNPLCGRNFEYYSEDPLLTGKLAAALTQGVQHTKATGTTVKHFACNQRENKRKQSNSVVSQRALREIYLRGFEIVIKQAQPMALMSSYNLLNGVHTANSYDLLTKVLRSEWGFTGFVMSDWTTTGEGGSSPIECMHAGNDLIMPGSQDDLDLLQNALQQDAPLLHDIKLCAARLIHSIRETE